MTALVWFRRDLRLADNPAWSAATRDHDVVVPLFVLDPRLWSNGASVRGALLHAHLVALDADLAARGGRLMVRYGDPAAVVPQVAAAGGADAVYFNADYSPYAVARDAAVADGVITHAFEGITVHAPGEITTAAGTPPRVFTPYFKRWAERPWGLWDTPVPTKIAGDQGDGLPPGVRQPLLPGGEAAASRRLEAFLERVDAYGEDRNRPDLDQTSRLGSDLHFGTIDARRVRYEVGETSPGRAAFVRQLCWRDFYLQVLHFQPTSVDQALRPEYAQIEWRNDAEDFAAWKAGRTGFPIVDAGMRQLATEGFIHNRVRMIVASFLVKDLLIDWRWGERWFRRHLVDGDLAQNVGNWQWVAGTGTDAAPYFRVFNPVSQGRKFDPDGAYVRRHVPELAAVPEPGIHAPWEVAPLELAAAGVTLGVEYPAPIVDHAEARERVLEVYGRARGSLLE